ncbi:hypothetical protein HMPREF0973_01516 [Prevotella veroralis F0319]|uniref:Uncharacterized protein n=1 Tax=Prevotella veroralis F0319 TaxID=649761 RepID=C9MPH4_9BACT|nr:hypothetical protein HMPREF0973_01516 [Prevotella veroralis F0319]
MKKASKEMEISDDTRYRKLYFVSFPMLLLASSDNFITFANSV